ncbi:LNS2-domain-containing protein [Pseudovirgaria hyperparasitica]|uniref:LNS2-domain-containing protein n=1 Tax=Pseudovirgaria hyperparasitica TaxID=470096 RepID=A0A6A6VTN5_9PEZI|nr:LNS2-domain-containing protein [Pseudovirgaria hyperparasitica]KAF2753156.1 LNS2-domain-containing protein [Pseudovirgaria hyperparasitica]
MQYVRSITGSVTGAWNAINPATLSGAIDVIVVEQDDGSLACSPFHVRFGKISLLRPYDKKVEFRVNNVKQEYSMKLGEGGEAFFVFETSQSIPEDMQTSPLVSPATSPEPESAEAGKQSLPEPEPLDLAVSGQPSDDSRKRGKSLRQEMSHTETDALSLSSPALEEEYSLRPRYRNWSGQSKPSSTGRSTTDEAMPFAKPSLSKSYDGAETREGAPSPVTIAVDQAERSVSPPPVSTREAVARAINLSKKLWSSNIPSHVNDRGDLMLDMTGWKSSEEESLKAELIARKILSEELEGPYDIGSLIEADENGNLWIYSSEEAKNAAMRHSPYALNEEVIRSTDAISDPGYHSDDGRSDTGSDCVDGTKGDTDSGLGLSPLPRLITPSGPGEVTRNFAKTLRLTSDQLKAMNLRPGMNPMSFSVGRAIITASIFLWRHDVPILISDIDGTITKSDVKGHIYYMIGSDWTHTGVARLYTDIVSNGYNIFYLTSRSVGQADSTRTYLNGVMQDGYKLPKGPVIMSPDRTFAALRREVYMRKPEIFKMACLRDIMLLFNKAPSRTPFYAGFGNRLTDALSYRSVNIPSTRIFTINANAEVSIFLETLGTYKTGYASMGEILDHYFPPVGLLVKDGGEEYTDFTYWREPTLDIDDFSASESEGDDADDAATLRSEDEGSEGLDEDESVEDLEASYYSRPSVDEEGELGDSIIESIEGDARGQDSEAEDEEDEDDEDDESAATDSDNEEGRVVARNARKATLTQDQTSISARVNLHNVSRTVNIKEPDSVAKDSNHRP